MNEACAKVIRHDVLDAQTAIFAHRSIHIKNFSIRSVDRNALIYGIGDPPQLPFVLTELFLRAFTVFDFRPCSIPTDDAPLFIPRRADTDEKPAILPVLAEQSRFQFVRGAAGYQTLTFTQYHIPIVRMNELCQVVFLRIGGGKAVIFACDLIGVETTSVRPQDEDMLRDGIDELAQLFFALPELFFRMLVLNGHRCQMRNLADEVLMLRGRATRLARVNRERS